MKAMQDKTVLITGGTSGIGKETALELAKQGATVVVVGRNPAKTATTVAEIKAASGNDHVDSLVADLASMQEVRRVADEFKARYDSLHVLLNNAGALFTKRYETVDGYEQTLSLNHLAYFLLTNLLLDTLKASTPARIINVSSSAHRGKTLNFDDLQHKKSYDFGGLGVYGQSKLANVLFTYELARRLARTGVTVNALHPGFVASGFGKSDNLLVTLIMPIIHRLFAIPVEEGAQTPIYLASSPEVEGVSGHFFEDCKPVKSSLASYDEAAQKRLWKVSEELTSINAPVA